MLSFKIHEFIEDLCFQLKINSDLHSDDIHLKMLKM